MIEIADQWIRIARKLRSRLIVIKTIFLDSSKQLVLRRDAVVHASRENIVFSVVRRVEDEAGRVQAISEARIVARGIPAVDKAQERCIRSNCLRIDCLKLCGRRRLDVSVRVHIVQLTVAERVVRYHLLYLGRQCIAPSLIVEKEKQFVFEDRPADAASELVAV